MKSLRAFLELQYQTFNQENAISEEYLDPLLVAREFKDEKVALFCALFAYGNVRAMLNFLRSCHLKCLIESKSVQDVCKLCTNKPYRFQSNVEIQAFFNALVQMQSLEQIFYAGYKQGGILAGIQSLQREIYRHLKQPLSKGLQFLVGAPIDIASPTSPLKRYNLFLRWVVRKDCLDLGLWESVKTQDLLLPLDTHTFRISKNLGLLKRKTYDFKAVLEVSATLRKFDRNDPIKYDFALYRIGQLGLSCV